MKFLPGGQAAHAGPIYLQSFERGETGGRSHRRVDAFLEQDLLLGRDHHTVGLAWFAAGKGQGREQAYGAQEGKRVHASSEKYPGASPGLCR